jgi:VanZ family protein
LWPALTWALFILVICGIPGQDLPKVTFLEWLKPDKVIHLFTYGILSWLLARAFRNQNYFTALHLHPNSWSFAIAILYGALIEVLQSTIFINRSGDLRDALANAIGALTGLWIYRLLLNRSNNKT